MELLSIRVKSVEVLPEARLAVARVEATSTRKVRGRPAARIQLEVAVKADRGGSASSLTARLYDQALAYLDVA